MSMPVSLRAFEYVLDIVERTHGISHAQLIGECRHAKLVAARRAAAVWLRHLGLSYPQIGKLLGGRHHATCMNLCGRLKKAKTEAEKHAAKVRWATKIEVSQ